MIVANHIEPCQWECDSKQINILTSLGKLRSREGQSEPTTTNAPVQDEAIQVVLGMNPNTSK